MRLFVEGGDLFHNQSVFLGFRVFSFGGTITALLIQDYYVDSAGAIVRLLLGNSIFHTPLPLKDLREKEFLKNFRSSDALTLWSDEPAVLPLAVILR